MEKRSAPLVIKHEMSGGQACIPVLNSRLCLVHLLGRDPMTIECGRQPHRKPEAIKEITHTFEDLVDGGIIRERDAQCNSPRFWQRKQP